MQNGPIGPFLGALFRSFLGPLFEEPFDIVRGAFDGRRLRLRGALFEVAPYENPMCALTWGLGTVVCLNE